MGAADRRGDGERDDAGAGVAPRGGAQRARAGALYVVATPIGNLRDLSLRAIDVLGSADRIAAEDTRVTGALLAHLGIAKRAFAVHGHNERQRAEEIVSALAGGESVALVTDAGTPGLSDPGARVVRAVQDAGLPVVPVPGPSAVAVAVSASGLDASCFAFLGFLPAQAKARRALLDSLAGLPLALVVYEAPHRVRATVASLADALGPGRGLVVARELTKAFETIARTTLGEADAWFAADANRERGEFVLVVDSPQASGETPGMSSEAAAWLDALVRELPPARAARIVAERTGAPRDLLYARATGRKDAPPE
ncbi:MAG: 16S rRNA (cytidine(1402)-2'-O)-methyltransferase [Burkholderiales bacterium]|nr:16S rRNA (cytidine(1402)-2'-O)-methyltransferase [Burkholderiales bacterium]